MENDAAQITEHIIDSFGGIRPMASKLDMPVTTVQGWKKRGIIPQLRHADIQAAALREDIPLDPLELAQSDPGGPVSRPIETKPMDFTPPAREVIYRRSIAGMIALAVSLLLVIGIAGAGFIGWRFYLQPLQARVTFLETHKPVAVDDDLVQRVEKLETELSQKPANQTTVNPANAAPIASTPAASATGGSDGDRVAALEQKIAELKAGASETEQLAKRLSDLQVAAGGRELLAQSIRDIQSSVAASQGEVERLSVQVASNGARLDKVDTVLADRRQQGLHAEAVILSAGQLHNALQDSKPFTKEATALRSLVGSDPQMLAVLDQIQPFADDGVETHDALRTDFGHLVPNIVRSAVVGDGNSWWRQALYHVESVISIRRTGADVPGDKADAIVARAEGKLEEDDLPGAISTLQALSGLSADLVQPWIHEAQNRVTVDAAESELARLAVNRVAAGNAQTPSNGAPNNGVSAAQSQERPQ